nr:MAG TPA: hypothetical protein [Bacteriophage sp.]
METISVNVAKAEKINEMIIWLNPKLSLTRVCSGRNVRIG